MGGGRFKVMNYQQKVENRWEMTGNCAKCGSACHFACTQTQNHKLVYFSIHPLHPPPSDSDECPQLL